MSELNEFLKVLAEAKKDKKHHIEEAKESLGDFLGVIAKAKAEDPKHQFLKQVKQSVQEDLGSLFATLAEGKAAAVDQVNQLVETVQLIDEIERPEVVGEFIFEDNKFLDPVTLTEVVVPEVRPAAEMYTKAEIDDLLKRNASFQQPDPKKADPTIKGLQDKLKFLEQAVGRIAATGPGSGEVNLRWLDDVKRDTIVDGRWLKYDGSLKKFVFDEINPFQVVNNVTEISSTYYEVHEDDYYIGVNNTTAPVTIALPSSTNSGRMLIIKDEDGDAETHPITVQGNVDNDPEGFIIQINNGAIQLIYRNGWRIV